MIRISLSLIASGAFLLAVGCGGIDSSRQAHPDALVGKLTYNGQPLKSVILTATGVDGTLAGGTTNEEGVYTIPSPPRGKLQLQLSAPGTGKLPFPAKYTKPNSDLTTEYTGGKQTFDIELKP
jgi:hypothetical protein